MIGTTTNDEEILSFIAEWFDDTAQVTKRYLLKFYPETQEVDMKELHGRKFLKRTKVSRPQNQLNPYPATSTCTSNITDGMTNGGTSYDSLYSAHLSRKDFYKGANLTIFSRYLKLVDYGDSITRDKLDRSLESSIVMILGSSTGKERGGVFDDIFCRGVSMLQRMEEESALTLVRAKTLSISSDLMIKTLGILESKQSSAINDTDDNDKDDSSSHGPCFVIEMRGENSIKKVKDVASTMNLLSSDNDDRIIIRATQNIEQVQQYQHFFFSSQTIPPTPSRTQLNYEDSTCCVVKPHIIKSKRTGALLNAFLFNGTDDARGLTLRFDVNAFEVFYLDHNRASEFYEGFNGAIKEYRELVNELSSGPLLALAVCRKKLDDNILIKDNESDKGRLIFSLKSQSPFSQDFRHHIAGPWDVGFAKKLYPDSVRAKFGVEGMVLNAIYCTDLGEVEETKRDIDFFF